MPLEVLLVLIVLGVGGIAAALHLLGLTAKDGFPNEDAARAAWLREQPQAGPHRIHLSADKRAALIETGVGTGLVWHMGADTAARFTKGAMITPKGTDLVVALHDFAAPRIRLRLDPATQTEWSTLLQ